MKELLTNDMVEKITKKVVAELAEGMLEKMLSEEIDDLVRDRIEKLKASGCFADLISSTLDAEIKDMLNDDDFVRDIADIRLNDMLDDAINNMLKDSEIVINRRS